MATDTTRIREYAVAHPDAVMTSLFHHVTDEDNLRTCFDDLDGAKAKGSPCLGFRVILGSAKGDLARNVSTCSSGRSTIPHSELRTAP